MLEEFYSREESDGIRLSWNYLPSRKLEFSRLSLPAGALYTPLNNKTSVCTASNEEMIMCRQCRAFMNPFCKITDEQPDVWWCTFCHFANRINSSQNFQKSAEPSNTTIEYILPNRSNLPPIFFYVMDTCFDNIDKNDAYKALKDSIKTSLSLLPEDALVGFISYGKNVFVHNLLPSDINMNYVFNGGKEHTLEEIQSYLGILPSHLRVQNNRTESFQEMLMKQAGNFLQPVPIAEDEIVKIIDSLPTNVFPHHEMKERPARATGTALQIASLLLGSLLGDMHTTGGHILTFIGGACTHGPGKIVGIPLKEPIRSHHDIENANSHIPNILANGNTKVEISLVKTAKAFYGKVTKQLISIGLSCNIFIGSYDQVGLFEMDEVCIKTGGEVIMTDSFSTSIFKQSLIKFFEKESDEEESYLDMGFNATLECRSSLDLQIQGLIGNATALPPRKDNRYIEPIISKNAVGEGNTNTWKLCNVNPRSTYAIYFDRLEDREANCYVQFLCHYQHPSRQLRLRVTTVQIPIVGPSEGYQLRVGFDQEAAIVLMARQAIEKLQPRQHTGVPAYEVPDIIKLLEKNTIDFCSKKAIFTKGNTESFTLEADYAMIPQFVYYLRRSPFIQVFNNSPDETSYTRHIFMHEDVCNSLIMIQPSLLSYDINTFGSTDSATGEIIEEPEPVILDSISLGPDKILLLDTFFQILIYHGSRIASWRSAGYQDMEDYQYFKEFLNAPKKEAIDILMNRFPLPRFIDCDEGGSQARFLTARLNPSSSYAGNSGSLLSGKVSILTDDMSLQSFIDNIKSIVVNRK